MQSIASRGCSAHWWQAACPFLEDLGACACASSVLSNIRSNSDSEGTRADGEATLSHADTVIEDDKEAEGWEREDVSDVQEVEWDLGLITTVCARLFSTFGYATTT